MDLKSVFILCSHSEGLSHFNAALEALGRGSIAIVSKGSRIKRLYKKASALIEIDCSKGSNLKNLISNLDFKEVVKMGKQAKKYIRYSF